MVGYIKVTVMPNRDTLVLPLGANSTPVFQVLGMFYLGQLETSQKAYV